MACIPMMHALLRSTYVRFTVWWVPDALPLIADFALRKWATSEEMGILLTSVPSGCSG